MDFLLTHETKSEQESIFSLYRTELLGCLLWVKLNYRGSSFTSLTIITGWKEEGPTLNLLPESRIPRE
jgi:hypothetical protein